MSAAAWESVALEIGAAEPIPELRGRQGPWTEEQYLVLGERRRWPRAELLDGQLLVTPPVTNDHNNAVGRLWLRLRAAAPKGKLVVVTNANLRINSGRYFIPDLIVTTRTDRGVVFNDPADVLLAAEVESPSTRARDRGIKPRVYAAAGIPWYVRIKMDGPSAPEVIAYRLQDGTYVEHARAHAGQRFHLDEPIEVSFDPAELDDYRL